MNLKAIYIASIGLGSIGGVSVGGYYLFKSQSSKSDSQSAQPPKNQETNDLNTQKLQAAETVNNRPSNVGGASSGPDQGQSLTSDPAITQSRASDGSAEGAQVPSR